MSKASHNKIKRAPLKRPDPLAARWVKPATGDIIPLILILLYIITGLIPTFGAFDVMGSQWLYVSMLNLASLGFILWKRNSFYGAAQKISGTLLSILYMALFLVVGLSIYFAINRTESLVNYARFATTFAAFLVIATLLFDRLHLFRIIAQVIALLLFFECAKTLLTFFKGLGDTDIKQLIFNLRGNAANKNILAASIVIKIPFTVYALSESKIAGKILNTITIAMAALAVFFINSRAAYVSLILVLLFYVVYTILLLTRKRINLKVTLLRLGLVFLPILVSFMISESVLRSATSPEDTPMALTYGSVSQRLASISMTAEGSDARSVLWSNALDFIKDHPLMGCGIGNWKLACIPYDRPFYDDFLISYHVHNDFLEVTAESGIPAGLLFLGLFICMGIYVLRIWLSNSSPEKKQVATFSLMALGVYSVDALLNFPSERPVMQSFFVLILALGLNSWLDSRKKDGAPASVRKNRGFILPLAFMFLVSLWAVWINRQVYKSLVIQSFVNNDLILDKPQGNSQDYMDVFPAYPNMNSQGLPMDLLIAKYLMKDKKYSEAIAYLDKSKKINPYIGYDDLIKARVYFAENNLDSAYAAVQRAFYIKPRSRSTYQLLNWIGGVKKDTFGLTNFFDTLTKYRNDPWTWNEYILAMIHANSTMDRISIIADSSLALFPDDTVLQRTRSRLPQSTNARKSNVTNQPDVQNKPSPDQIAIFNKGNEAYGKQDYKTAISYFLQYSALNKTDHLGLEAAGLSYYALGDYPNAIRYLKESISKNINRDGKAEYYIGQSYLLSAKKEDACTYFKLAAGKNFAGADAVVKANCGN